MKPLLTLALLLLTACAGTVERHGVNMRAKHGEAWTPVVYEKQHHESNPRLSSFVWKESPGAPNEIVFYYPQDETPPTDAEKAAIIYEHYQRKVIDPDEALKLRFAGIGPAFDAGSTIYCLGKDGFVETNKLMGPNPSNLALGASVIIPFVMFQYLPSKDTPVWQSWGARNDTAKYAGAYRAGIAAKNLIKCS